MLTSADAPDELRLEVAYFSPMFGDLGRDGRIVPSRQGLCDEAME
jgi:hypothetical protein